MNDIEVLEAKFKETGCLRLVCNMRLGKMILVDVQYFKKESQEWINLPQKSWKEEGEWRNKKLVKFVDLETETTYKNLILEKIKKYIEESKKEDEEKIVLF